MRKLIMLLLTLLTLVLFAAPVFASTKAASPTSPGVGPVTNLLDPGVPTEVPIPDSTGSSYTACYAYGRWHQKCQQCGTNSANRSVCTSISQTAACYCDNNCVPSGICIWSQR